MNALQPLARQRLAGLARAGLRGAAIGSALWTATEYVTHRWVLHGPFGRGRLAWLPLGRVHRNHHRDPDHTLLWVRAAGHLSIAAVGAGGARIAALLAPSASRVAIAAAAGSWSAGYSTYDIVHWRLHHRPPTTARGIRLRQRHFRHHFGAPKANLGVTVGWLDSLFGTEIPDRPVVVPRRLAPAWLHALGPHFSTGDQPASAGNG